MKGKITIAAALLLLIIGLTACGNRVNVDDTKENNTVSVVETIDTAESRSESKAVLSSKTEHEESKSTSSVNSEKEKVIVSSLPSLSQASSHSVSSTAASSNTDVSSKVISSSSKASSPNEKVTITVTTIPEQTYQDTSTVHLTEETDTSSSIVIENTTETQSEIYYDPPIENTENSSAEPVGIIPEQQEQLEPQEPAEPEQPNQKAPYDRPFDIEVIRQDMIDYAVSKGFIYDETVNLHNAGWSFPTATYEFNVSDLRQWLQGEVDMWERELAYYYDGVPQDSRINVIILEDENYPGEYKIYFPRG